MRFEVYAKPRAKKSRIVGWRPSPQHGGEALEVALAAPPVDGAANEELVRLLSDVLGITKRSVEIVRGTTSQNKLVSIATLTPEVILLRLGASCGIHTRRGPEA